MLPTCIHLGHVFHLFSVSSLSNKEECKLVMELVKVIIDSGAVPTRIGIITPYKHQEHLIKDWLSRRCVACPCCLCVEMNAFCFLGSLDCREIDIGTVDGFQVRKKKGHCKGIDWI